MPIFIDTDKGMIKWWDKVLNPAPAACPDSDDGEHHPCQDIGI